MKTYQVTIPEYKLKTYKNTSKDYATWFNLKIPKVYYDNQPDFERIGNKIDRCLIKHFLNKKVAIRVLGSEEHRGKSINDIINIIKTIGHDRYNKNRKGDRYKNIDDKHIDFFALDFKIKNKAYFKHFIEPFYFWPLVDRKKPIRIDIAIIYDLSKLKRVKHSYKGREKELKRDGFVFKNPQNKKDAVLGIIKIL